MSIGCLLGLLCNLPIMWCPTLGREAYGTRDGHEGPKSTKKAGFWDCEGKVLELRAPHDLDLIPDLIPVLIVSVIRILHLSTSCACPKVISALLLCCFAAVWVRPGWLWGGVGVVLKHLCQFLRRGVGYWCEITPLPIVDNSPQLWTKNLGHETPPPWLQKNLP